MAIIYMATNLINGKRYIGFTSNTLKRRIWQHTNDAFRTDRVSNTAFSNAIRSYGIDSFRFAVLIESEDAEFLLRVEEPRLIKALGTNVQESGYNICSGGRGRIGCPRWNKGIPRDERTKEKIRAKAIGRKQSAETISKRVAKTKGQKRSDQTKAIMASRWLITFPDGHEEIVSNLLDFCRLHCLHQSCMINVANGSRRQHKGFRCIRLSDGSRSRHRKTTSNEFGSDISEGSASVNP